MFAAHQTKPAPAVARAAPPIQAKLSISQPGDRHEREADAAADQVMAMPAGATAAASAGIYPSAPSAASAAAIQRACSGCQGSVDHDEISRSAAPSLTPLSSSSVSRAGLTDDDLAQAGAMQRAATGPVADAGASVAGALDRATRRGGQPLPPATRGFLEPRFGHDFGAVRIHADPAAGALAQRLQARAFTTGHHVFFAPGEFQPDASAGKRLIAHELAHVVQQSGPPSTAQRMPAIQRETADAGTPAPPVTADAGAPATPNPVDAGAQANPNQAPAWTPPARCGSNFCRAFPTRADAIDSRDGFGPRMWSALRIGIQAAVSSRVMPLWDEWAAGGGPVRSITSTFGADFQSSPTTATATRFLLREIRTAVAARTAPPAGPPVNVALSTLIPGAVAALDTPGGANEMNFNMPGDIPGNLAGGIGKDEAANPIGATPSPQDDARLVTGSVDLFATPTGQTVIPHINFTVKDTLDLCPGDCGSAAEQLATVPMSRWEASGISGDVPYTVDFPPPVIGLLPFTVP